MKRAITALALAGVLMLSVVACQVYNPTDNSTMYTAMRSEGATSWAAYIEKFNDADNDGKYDLFKEYETFRKLHKDQAVWETAIKAYEDADAAYIADPTSAVKEKARKDARAAVLYTADDLKTLWDKEYDVLWDYNSKL